MTRTLCPTATPRYKALFSGPTAAQPFDFYLLENLLTARMGSMFPTNGAGPDEDVNVYLAHLLGRFLRGDHDPSVQFGSGALFAPPSVAISRGQRAAYYRANADHRLLFLGLFGRGDGKRHRNQLFGLTTAETRSRDMAAGRTCYEAAANVLRDRSQSASGVVAVWEKLADHFDDYVHVLSALATRHLGLGARISSNDLNRLLPPDTTAATRSVNSLLAAPPPLAALDDLLDLWLAHQKNPDPLTASRVRDMADRLGVELDIT